MRHKDTQSAQFKIKGQCKIFRPLLIIVTTYCPGGSNLLQLIKNPLAADIPTVENTVTALKLTHHLRPEQVVRIGDYTNVHNVFPPFALWQ